MAQAWSPPTPQFSARWVLQHPEHSSADPLPVPSGQPPTPLCLRRGLRSPQQRRVVGWGGGDSSTDSTLGFPWNQNSFKPGTSESRAA